MNLANCQCKCSCTLATVIAAVIIGVIAAFLQITGVITVTAAFLWVVFGIAIVYLAVLAVTAGLRRRTDNDGCCGPVNTLLVGILGTILFAVILLAVGIVATSVISAILVGLLLFFFTLTVGGTACYVRCLTDCAA